ncbi:MAG: hypothetical protein NZ518_06165, partial [Dehalococcoidia bacterium]|nr:hypothetical protein [Dehalococcoidia bacterium]
VGQIRAGLAPASHTHTIADIATLQAALDARQPLDADLTALAANTGNGLWARTGNGTGAARTITAGAGITVANGDGVAGNPTIALNFSLANIPQSGATAGQVLKWNGTAWAPANDATGGGASAPAIVTGSPTTTYQATGLTGDTVVKLTLGGNTAISAPTFTGLAANSVYFIRYELTATGGTRTPSFSGFTLAGGVDPARPIPDGTTLIVDTEAHTDSTGAVTIHRLIGAYDPAAEPDATIAPAEDYIVFGDASDGGRPKRARLDAVRDMAGRPGTARFDIPNPAARTEVLINENVVIGTLVGVVAYTDQGSVTVTVQIANKTSATNWTPTGATAVAGMSAIAVTNAPSRASATGANTMGKSGTAGRMLLIQMASPSGSPQNLTLEFEYRT